MDGSSPGGAATRTRRWRQIPPVDPRPPAQRPRRRPAPRRRPRPWRERRPHHQPLLSLAPRPLEVGGPAVEEADPRRREDQDLDLSSRCGIGGGDDRRYLANRRGILERPSNHDQQRVAARQRPAASPSPPRGRCRTAMTTIATAASAPAANPNPGPSRRRRLPERRSRPRPKAVSMAPPPQPARRDAVPARYEPLLIAAGVTRFCIDLIVTFAHLPSRFPLSPRPLPVRGSPVGINTLKVYINQPETTKSREINENCGTVVEILSSCL